ncbi:MAG: hypothetical protein AB7Q16_05510 [Vicinamibacterales bacterium]
MNLRVVPPPFVRVLPMQHPASEIYFFEPLNERVPVYQRPFTLRQELVVEATRDAERALRQRTSLRLEATFEYQACDDTVCYNPVSVPLAWTVSLTPHE